MRARALGALLAAGSLLLGSPALAGQLGFDFRVSELNGSGTPDEDASNPAIAYDLEYNRFLVVWSGDNPDGEHRIHGQLIHGQWGTPVVEDFQISLDPPPGGAQDDFTPVVAFSDATGEYLVVWSSDRGHPGAFEIHARAVSRLGEPLGSDSVELSSMGSNAADTSFFARTPAIAWDSLLDHHVVAWVGQDDTAPLGPGETRIFAQRVDAGTLAQIGSDDWLVSSAPAGSGPDFDEYACDLAFSPVTGQFLLVFEADPVAAVGSHPSEIVLQRIDSSGSTGLSNIISVMGASIDDGFTAEDPAIAYDETNGLFLVTWHGDDLVDGEFEIHGQFLDQAGAEVGVDDFRISDMGPDGSTSYGAFHPDVMFSATTASWLVVWRGDDNALTTDNEWEIFGQVLDDAGVEKGGNDICLSEIRGTGSPIGAVGNPAIVWGEFVNVSFLVYSADEDVQSILPGEFEIFGQGYFIDDVVTGVPSPLLPEVAALHPNVPNPFNPATTVHFDVPQPAQRLRLELYDSMGRRVARLHDGPSPAGRHQVVWHGQDQAGAALASGVYHLRMELDGQHVGARKLTLVR